MSALSAIMPPAFPFVDDAVMLPMTFSFPPDFFMEFAKMPTASAPAETSRLPTVMFSKSPTAETAVVLLGEAIMPAALPS